jgi:hypothetical protein
MPDTIAPSNEFDYTGFDVEELRLVARVLSVTNPSRCGGDPASTMQYIVTTARANINEGDATYVGTMGFYVCGYWYAGNMDDWRYKVTLAAWGVNEYINRMSATTWMVPKEVTSEGKE